MSEKIRIVYVTSSRVSSGARPRPSKAASPRPQRTANASARWVSCRQHSTLPLPWPPAVHDGATFCVIESDMSEMMTRFCACSHENGSHSASTKRFSSRVARVCLLQCLLSSMIGVNWW